MQAEDGEGAFAAGGEVVGDDGAFGQAEAELIAAPDHREGE